MNDLSYTPTRQAALSAFQKAQDAYATARQAMERVNGMEARMAALEVENAELRALVPQQSTEKPKPRRVA